MKKVLILLLLIFVFIMSSCGEEPLLRFEQNDREPEYIAIVNSNKWNDEIEEIVIPNTVNNLPVVIIKSSERETGAFQDFNNLKTVSLPDNLRYVPYNCFCNCKNLTDVFLPSEVEYISEMAFCGCEALESITIPDKVEIIEKSAFSSCKNLSKVNFSKSGSLKTIEKHAFYYTKLKEVNIPEGVEKIDDAFDECVTKIYLPNSIKTFKHYYLSTLETTTYKNVHYIGNNNNPYLFALWYEGESKGIIHKDCEHVMGKSASISVSGSFFRTRAFKNVYIVSVTFEDGGSLKEIPAFMFHNCINLTSVEIPKTVTVLGDSCFYGCTGITSITIPKSVSSIETCAFRACYNLSTLIYEGTMAEWNSINKYTSRTFNWFGLNTWLNDWAPDPVGTNVVHCTDGDVRFR